MASLSIMLTDISSDCESTNGSAKTLLIPPSATFEGDELVWETTGEFGSFSHRISFIDFPQEVRQKVQVALQNGDWLQVSR